MPGATKISSISSDTKPAVFARHESFHPRFGWLKKGFDKAGEDPSIFLKDDASVTLGVGKNMVRAIRYWCTAFKVLGESGDSKNRVLSQTDFGKRLFGDNGWDPFMETDGSLWLLHWNLLKSECTATSWEFIFGSLRQSEFTQEDIVLALREYLQISYSDISVAESSLKGDVLCFLRMYAQSHEASRINEETIVCPFVDLGLVERIPDSKAYVFRVGEKPNLPNEILMAVCLEYASEYREGHRSINLSNLLYDRLSPGQCFKLTESSMYAALEQICEESTKVWLSNTAGIAQLQFIEDPKLLADDLLRNYFISQRGV